MPRSEVARRERDKLVARVGLGRARRDRRRSAHHRRRVLRSSWLADQRLAAEQAQTNELLIEIASLSEVSQALATEAELTDFRTEAMATDLAWAPVLAKVTGVLPADTSLTGFDFAVGGAPQGDDPTLEPGLVGHGLVRQPDPLDIVAIIRSLRGVEGVLFADGQSVTSSTGRSRAATPTCSTSTFDQTDLLGRVRRCEEGED